MWVRPQAVLPTGVGKVNLTCMTDYVTFAGCLVPPASTTSSTWTKRRSCQLLRHACNLAELSWHGAAQGRKQSEGPAGQGEEGYACGRELRKKRSQYAAVIHFHLTKASLSPPAGDLCNCSSSEKSNVLGCGHEHVGLTDSLDSATDCACAAVRC